jgi:hypothetical protein
MTLIISCDRPVELNNESRLIKINQINNMITNLSVQVQAYNALENASMNGHREVVRGSQVGRNRRDNICERNR